jgi:hypothetical protein
MDCVLIVILRKSLSMDEKTAKEIQELRNQIGNVTMSLLALCAEVKALKTLAIVLWEQQGIEMTGGKTISDVLELLKEEVLDEKLKKLADLDMAMASKLKRRLEKFLKNKNPQTPNS